MTLPLRTGAAVAIIICSANAHADPSATPDGRAHAANTIDTALVGRPITKSIRPKIRPDPPRFKPVPRRILPPGRSGRGLINPRRRRGDGSILPHTPISEPKIKANARADSRELRRSNLDRTQKLCKTGLGTRR
jgi:hypothetical protein